MSEERFVELFTRDRPVLFNYHGYATELQGLLFGRPRMERMTVRGYKEEGSTTTPFDMMLVNGVSRFDVASWAVKAWQGSEEGTKTKMVGEVEGKVKEVKRFIEENGKGECSANVKLDVDVG